VCTSGGGIQCMVNILVEGFTLCFSLHSASTSIYVHEIRINSYVKCTIGGTSSPMIYYGNSYAPFRNSHSGGMAMLIV